MLWMILQTESSPHEVYFFDWKLVWQMLQLDVDNSSMHAAGVVPMCSPTFAMADGICNGNIMFGSARQLDWIFYFYYFDVHGNLLKYFHIL